MPRTPETDFSTLQIRKVPGVVLDAAKAKAADHKPPLSLRWVVIELLRKWVEHDRPAELDPKPKGKPRWRKPGKWKPKTAPETIPDPAGSPDLGGSF